MKTISIKDAHLRCSKFINAGVMILVFAPVAVLMGGVKTGLFLMIIGVGLLVYGIAKKGYANEFIRAFSEGYNDARKEVAGELRYSLADTHNVYALRCVGIVPLSHNRLLLEFEDKTKCSRDDMQETFFFIKEAPDVHREDENAQRFEYVRMQSGKLILGSSPSWIELEMHMNARLGTAAS